MSVLGNAVVSGAASHSYDAQRNIDQFVCTDRLVRNWSWLFPGAKLTAGRLQKYLLEIEGSRSRYIREGWLAADKTTPHRHGQIERAIVRVAGTDFHGRPPRNETSVS